MDAIINTIICYVTWAVMTMWSYAADLFSLIIAAFISVANLALSILPAMTLPAPQFDGPFLGLVNGLVNLGLLIDAIGLLIGMTVIWKLVKWAGKYFQ